MTDLREREDELNLAGGLLAAARAGQGGLAIVEGRAGIGKTSLLRAVAAQAAQGGMATLGARGSELEQDFAFGVVHQLLDPVLLHAGPAARSELLSGAAGFAAPLFEARHTSATAGPDAGHAMLHGLFWLCANIALRGPLAMFVDDVQWCDEASARFLAFLAPRLDGLPIALVVVTRPTAHDGAGVATRLLADPDATVLHPRPLSAAAAAAVLANRLRAAPEAVFVAACHAATGGNPFLLEELARAAQQVDLPPTAASAARIAQLGPQAITRRVGLALERLGHDATALADAVAVLGDGAEIMHASRLAGLEYAAAAAAADALAAAGILEPGLPLRFLHSVLGAAVAERSPRVARALAHARAAQLLAAAHASPDRVAAHLLAADPAGDPARVTLLRDAASDAAGRGAPATAVAFLRRALDEQATNVQDRAALLHALGRAEHDAQEPTALRTLESAHQAAADPVARAQIARDLAVAAGPGDAARSVTLLANARDAVADLDRELADRLEAERLLLCIDLPRFTPMASPRAEAVAQRTSDQPLSESERLMLVALARDRNDHGVPAAEAQTLIIRALQRPLVDGLTADTGLITAMVVLYELDRHDLAGPLLDAALDTARRRGSAPAFATATFWRGVVAWRCGDLPSAEAEARAALDWSIEHDWRRLPALAILVYALTERGACDQADALLAAHAMSGPLSPLRSATPLLAARGRLHYAMGRLTQARTDLQDVETRLGGPDAEHAGNLETLVTLVRVLVALGERDHAERRAASALRAGRKRALARAEGLGLLAAGLVAPRGEDVTLLEQACARFAASPARLEEARALVDLGSALRRANHRAEARKPLRRALQLARACGADPLAEEARQELTVTGARVPREITTGVASLTPSEQRIARMAADGKSNPEIAQGLFITVKTVEMHLANTYRKLDIRSRRDLPAALNTAAPEARIT